MKARSRPKIWCFISLSSFNIKQVLPLVIHSVVFPFSIHLSTCVIIFSWLFINSLIQNLLALSRPHVLHFGSLRNCCLNLTASIMISPCFLLWLTLSLTPLIHYAFSLCFTFWNQISLQSFLFSAVGFTSFSLLFPSILSNKSLFMVRNNLFCTFEAWWF